MAPPPDPEHLFEQALFLVERPGNRQVDLRRAISAAYYGLFHFTLTAAADLVIGAANQSAERYALVYRSVDHTRLRQLCSQITGTRPQNMPSPPEGNFGEIAGFAAVISNLYELRNLADYDPSTNFTIDEAKIEIDNARQAIKWFREATPAQQEMFLTLLLFKPR